MKIEYYCSFESKKETGNDHLYFPRTERNKRNNATGVFLSMQLKYVRYGSCRLTFIYWFKCLFFIQSMS